MRQQDDEINFSQVMQNEDLVSECDFYQEESVTSASD
jgi:hypothetical protein